MKTCTKCGIEKPLTEFFKEKRGMFGVRSQCKSCFRTVTLSSLQARQRASNDGPTNQVVQRFLSRLAAPNAETGCIEWTGGKSTHGYGRFWGIGTHRFAWIVANGPIPSGMHILHRCDNPPCCNPDHLFLGTQKDNVQDAAMKGRLRHAPMKGEKHPRAKLTAEDVLEIRRLYKEGVVQVELASRYGVRQGTISGIVLNKTWRCLLDDHGCESSFGTEKKFTGRVYGESTAKVACNG